MLLGLLSDCFHIAFSLLGPYKKWRAPSCRLTPGGSQTKKHGWDLIGIGILRALRLFSGWFQIAFRLLVPYYKHGTNTKLRTTVRLFSDTDTWLAPCTQREGWNLQIASILVPDCFQMGLRGCRRTQGDRSAGAAQGTFLTHAKIQEFGNCLKENRKQTKHQNVEKR